MSQWDLSRLLVLLVLLSSDPLLLLVVFRFVLVVRGFLSLSWQLLVL